ncbi:hypothetical protein [Colwellia piezophila]|uniref:hypothetical protein n=1 Tax=Colwellia piezophila TaxID=211668 RepID=UPI0003764EE3|nr:hypothetical protein [Colwellia piezophila]
MTKLKNSLTAIVTITLLSLLNVQHANTMALRSFVALPIDKYGYIVRFSYQHLIDGDSGNFITSVAYGLSNKQALLFGIPYKVTPNDEDRVGDLSALYRHTVIQHDFLSGTSRLALLTGAIVPHVKDRDPAIQAGFVYSFFKDRYEFDIDALYQAGVDNRPDSGRYDISWQYRLSPSVYPDWGIASELHVVTELNGRWQEGNKITQQVTVGLQMVHPRWVIEGGFVKNLSNNNDLSAILSARFHF